MKNLFSRGLRALVGLLAMILVFTSVKAQSTDHQWVPVGTPQGVQSQAIRCAIIIPDETIYVFSTGRRIPNVGTYIPGQTSVSKDKGQTWVSYPIPFKAYGLSSAVTFKDKVYIICDEGVISSTNCQTWTMAKSGANFYNISASSSTLFAFAPEGLYYRTTDGINWYRIDRVPGGSHDFIMSTAEDGTVRAFAINYRLGSRQDRRHSMPAVSNDNGLTWVKQDSIPLLAYDADSYQGKYSVVGPSYTESWEERVASVGDYDFSYPGGTLSSVHFFNGHCYFGGALNLDNGTNSPAGFIMMDGEIDLPFLTGTMAITKIVSNRTTLAMAISLNGDLFILGNGVFSSAPSPSRVTVDNDFQVYPNPTYGEITVKTTDKTIVVRNTQGAALIQRQVYNDETRLDLSELPAGIYFINSKRVIKQ
jgi:hypothetical protein